MTVSNGSLVVATDLTAMVSTALGLVQADNAQLPAGLQMTFRFDNLVASTPAARRRSTFIVPCDLLLEVVAVQAANFTASSTLSVGVTADVGETTLVPVLVDDIADTSSVSGSNYLVFWPVKVVGTVGAGLVKLTRLLYDGTKGKPNASATTSRAVRLLMKGSTITVSALTTSTATPSTCQVTLVMREMWQRE